MPYADSTRIRIPYPVRAREKKSARFVVAGAMWRCYIRQYGGLLNEKWPRQEQLWGDIEVSGAYGLSAVLRINFLENVMGAE